MHLFKGLFFVFGYFLSTLLVYFCKTLLNSMFLVLQAHEQLRAVLLTLLEELPSDLPILLLGTSSISLAEFDGNPYSIFPQRSVYV